MVKVQLIEMDKKLLKLADEAIDNAENLARADGKYAHLQAALVALECSRTIREIKEI